MRKVACGLQPSTTTARAGQANTGGIRGKVRSICGAKVDATDGNDGKHTKGGVDYDRRNLIRGGSVVGYRSPVLGPNDVSNIGAKQGNSRTSSNRDASPGSDSTTSCDATKPSLDLGHHETARRNRRLLQPLCHHRPLQQVRCWMETFTHRIRRARCDVGQGNNSRTRCRSRRLIHSRRSRSRDDIAVSLAVPCGTQHHAVAFATTHEQRQRVLRIAIQNLEVRTRLARSANDFRRVARLVSDCIRLVQQSTSPRRHRVLHSVADLPRSALATSSHSSVCARPVLETASRTICS